jgi:arylsulfatase A-like enzyme
VGKTHFGPGQRIHQGFEHVEPPADHVRFLVREGEVDGYRHGLGGNEFSPAIDPMDPKLSLTSWVTDRSLDFLETRDDTRPFFLWASYNHPHPPFTPSLPSWELYRDKSQPKRVTGDWSARFEDVPDAFTAVSQELSMTQRFDDEQIETIRKAYAACITEVDLSIGRIFGHLQTQKLLDNTWIIFTTDHGEMLGDHWLGGKCVPFDAAARIPFLVRPPHGNRDHRHDWRGSTSDATVCLADILPTCAGIAGAPVPEGVSGQDLQGLLDGSLPEREAFYHSCMYLHAVRQGPWKLCRETINGSELLFNLAEDPHEERNRLGDPDCADIQADLTGLLDAHISRHGQESAAAHDPGVISTTDHLPTATQPGFRSGRSPAC